MMKAIAGIPWPGPVLQMDPFPASEMRVRRPLPLWRPVERLLRRDGGSASIEFVIWAPFFLFITAFVAEIAFVFTVNASMWNVSRDVIRRLAYHQIDPGDARDEVLRYAMIPDAGYVVNVVEDVETVTMTVSLPVANASLLGLVTAHFDGDLTVTLAMLREPV